MWSMVYESNADIIQLGPFATEEELWSAIRNEYDNENMNFSHQNAYVLDPLHKMEQIHNDDERLENPRQNA